MAHAGGTHPQSDGQLAVLLERLRAREVLYRCVLDALDEAVVLYGVDGTVRMSNFAAEAVFGDAPPDAIFDVDGRLLAADELPAAVTLRTGRPVMEAIYRVRRADGSERWVCTSTVPLRPAPNASLDGVLATSSDITIQQFLEGERERRNDDLRSLNAELRQAQAVRDHMTAVATHELRTPLTAITGYTELLLELEAQRSACTCGAEPAGGPSRRDALTRIGHAASRLQHLVDDLLTLSSLDAGGLRLDIGDVDLDSLLTESLAAHPNGGRVTLQRLPQPVLLRADRGRVLQILENLISNAFKYGAEPVLLAARANDAGWIDLEVSDGGDGVPAALRSTVFDTFMQAADDNGQRAGGVGLGLSVVRALAEAHGGSARYESVDPHGARFVVRLPAANRASGPAR